jgi:copper chaperone CopZ
MRLAPNLASRGLRRVEMEQQALTDEVRLTSSKITSSDDVDSVESMLGSLDGVRSVQANPDSHTVTIKYDPTIVNMNLIRERLESGGFSIDTTA